MLPTGIFRSRWATLFWAAGILWTAYDVSSSGKDATAKPTARDAVGDRVDPAALATLANASPS